MESERRPPLVRPQSIPTILALAVILGSCAPEEVVEGLFTQEQADRGAMFYAGRCAACHGVELDGGGGISPPLAGAAVLAGWERAGRTLDDFLYVLATTMPPGAARTMSDEERLTLIAFILEQNGYPSGPEPLVADPTVLRDIRIESLSASTAEAPMPPDFIEGEGGLAPSATGPTQEELSDASVTRGDWLYHTGDYTGRRFAALDQVDVSNAAELEPVCEFPFGESGNNQTGPIVYRGVMYVTTTMSTMAIGGATCELVWRDTWEPRDYPASHVNRGVAIKDGRVVRATADGYLIALDADSGRLLWAHHVASTLQGEFLSMAPLVYRDLVYIGPAGSEAGGNGWIRAFSLEDGKEVWRFDVIPAPGEPGSETWVRPPGVPVGGGTVWTPFSLDVERGLLFVATANPAPDFPAEIRGGANLYTNTLLALDARSGELVWYDQMVPSDDHDWDLTQASPLFRSRVGGVERDLIGTAGKDGILRVLDRDTHERLYEAALTTVENVEAEVTTEGTHACPGILGGVEWNGPAYNPLTNLIYTPAVDWCGTFYSVDSVRFVPGALYLGGTYVEDVTSQGWVTAVDGSDGSVAWRYRSERPMIAAVTTTSGVVVFTAETTGDFLVFDATSGQELYRHDLGGPAGGGVVTYAVDGKQYVAVVSGQPSPFWIEEDPGTLKVSVFALPD